MIVILHFDIWREKLNNYVKHIMWFFLNNCVIFVNAELFILQEFRDKLLPPNSAIRMNLVRSNSYNSLNSNNNSGGGVTPPVAGTPSTQPRGLQRQQSAPVQQQTTPTKPHVHASPASLRSPSRSQSAQHTSSPQTTPSRTNSLPNAQPKKLIPVSNGLRGQVI